MTAACWRMGPATEKLFIVIVLFTLGLAGLCQRRRRGSTQKTSGIVYAGVTHAEGDDL